MSTQIETMFGKTSSPTLPSKIFGSHTPERLDERRAALDVYLQRLLLMPEIFSNTHFFVFMCVGFDDVSLQLVLFSHSCLVVPA